MGSDGDISKDVGQDTLDVLLERVPAAPAHAGEAAAAEPGDFEVVDDEEAALLQVRSEPLGFRIGHVPPADFDDVRDRILEQLRVVQPQAVDFLGARPEVADLVQNPHQVLFGERIAVRPCGQALVPVAARRGRVIHANERELAVVGRVADLELALPEAAVPTLRGSRGGQPGEHGHHQDGYPNAADPKHGRHGETEG
jgi:hypothetical protein